MHLHLSRDRSGGGVDSARITTTVHRPDVPINIDEEKSMILGAFEHSNSCVCPSIKYRSAYPAKLN